MTRTAHLRTTRRAVILRSSALSDDGLLALGFDEAIVDCRSADVADALNRLVLLARAHRMPVTAVIADPKDRAVVGVVDTAVDGLCLADPEGPAAILDLRRACHYPPTGTRGVATTRSLGYGLTKGDLALVTQGRTPLRAGIALSRPPDDIEAFAEALNSDAATLPPVDFVALWANPKSAADCGADISLRTAIAGRCALQAWGIFSSAQVPEDALELRAWSELELAAQGLLAVAGARA